MKSSGPTVKIIVGADKVSWTLHENVLCHFSEYYKKAFQGPFREAEEKEMVLEDDDPDVFGHFVDFIYRQGLTCHENTTKTTGSMCLNGVFWRSSRIRLVYQA